MTRTTSTQRDKAKLATLQEKLDFSRQLQALSNKIHATDNISQIMLDLAPDICELFQCERLTLYAVNTEKTGLISKVKMGINSDKELKLPISRQSIAGYVAVSGKTVRIDNLYDPAELQAIDPNLCFNERVDQITGYRSTTMLAAPLLQGAGKELVGVLQLINQKADGHFNDLAKDGLDQFATTLALAFAQRIKVSALLPKRYEALAEQGVISAAELELAYRWAQRKNLDLEQVLVKDFQVAPDAMGRALAKQWDLAYQAFQANWRPEPDVLRKLNRAVCEKNQWLARDVDRSVLVVVTTDPDNRAALEEVKRTFPYNQIVFRYTTRQDFAQMLEQYFPK